MCSTTSLMEECKRQTTDFVDGMYEISGNFARWIARKGYRRPEREREREREYVTLFLRTKRKYLKVMNEILAKIIFGVAMDLGILT